MAAKSALWDEEETKWSLHQWLEQKPHYQFNYYVKRENPHEISSRMFCPSSEILHLGCNSSCTSVQTHAAAAPFCSFASAQREQWPPPLQHCSSVDSRTMAANPAPLYIYIYTKSYRNVKVGGGGGAGVWEGRV